MNAAIVIFSEKKGFDGLSAVMRMWGKKKIFFFFFWQRLDGIKPKAVPKYRTNRVGF